MSDTTKTAAQLVAALAREGVKLPVKVHPEDRASVADANDADLFVVDNNSDRLDENAYAITELLVDLINTTALSSSQEEAAPVEDTWFTDRSLPVMAMSGDVESDRVLKLHFRRRVTDADRQEVTAALNLHQASLASPLAADAREPASDLDWSGFAGVKLNKAWAPDLQELVYTALNFMSGEGDADDDAADQIIERLLATIRYRSALVPATSQAKGSGGVAAIAAERQRQVEAEGWTPEHDDHHTEGVLAIAAACYALNATGGPDCPDIRFVGFDLWPWDDAWWKPTTPRRDLIKAGALIAAEIDRLDRSEAREGGNNG